MQTCFFALSGILPRDEAIAKIKEAIRKTYGKRGETVLRGTSPPSRRTRWRRCSEVAMPGSADSALRRRPVVPSTRPTS